MTWYKFGIAIAAAAGLAAQPPAFEVASVKPSGPKSVRGSEGGPGTTDPGRYRFTRASLKDLIAIAYHVDYFQILSRSPLDNDSFDVAVTVPPGSTRDQFRAMMRNLLAARFHLEAHTESREFPAWELTVLEGGPKFHPRPPGAPPPAKPAGEGWPDLPPDRPGMSAWNSIVGAYQITRLRIQSEPIRSLADALHQLGEPVIDKTGLEGEYDLALEFTLPMPGASIDAASEPPVVPDLFTALERHLGLRLVHKKLPFDVVVVESFSRQPTEN